MKELNKLIKSLKELKTQGVNEDSIPEILNLISDYQYEIQDWPFEDLEHEMVSYDSVMECIKYKADQYDLWGVQNIVEGLEKADYYKDNGDGFDNIDSEDVEDWLQEIIDRALQLKKDKKNEGTK